MEVILPQAVCNSYPELRPPFHRNHWYYTGAGQLLPGIETRVLKSNGSLARCGERGELYIKTPSVALGYLDNVEA